MTSLSFARYFPRVFIRINTVYSARGAKGSGPRDRPGPATEMRSYARAHVIEKPARVVGDSDAWIVVYAQHPIVSHPIRCIIQGVGKESASHSLYAPMRALCDE
jgi:hypothetical protein